MRSFWLLLSAVAACSSSGSSTRGQRGLASFAYVASPGCEDGCNLEQNAVAAGGAQQLVSVTGTDFASVGSGTPAVATFTKTAAGVQAVTAMPGSADLILLDGAGIELDRVTVQVAEVAYLDFQQGWSGAGPVVLETVPITAPAVTKRDAGQRILLGSNAVHFATSGNLTSLGAPPLSDPNAPPSIIESWMVEGTAGSGDLTGSNGAQSFDLPFTVVTLAELAGLSVSTGDQFVGKQGASVDSVGTVIVTTASGAAVYGPTCAWSVSDASVEIAATGDGNRLDQPAAATVTISLTKTGNFTATCTIGGLTGTTMLSRPD